MDTSVEQLLTQLTANLETYLAQNGRENPVIIGIRTGGAWLAQRLHQALNPADPLGVLDISFYRDDFSRLGLHPDVKPSSIPFDVEARHLILVDDVLQTGRTIRAALNEIFDYGRPASVTLACLVELSGRELPIRADVVGQALELAPNEHIKLTGPRPLQLEIKTMSQANG